MYSQIWGDYRKKADLITVFKIFMSILDVDQNSVFLPPTRRSLRGHPYKVQATAEDEGRPFRWGLWNMGISFRHCSSFCQHFQEEVGESLDKSLSPSSLLTERSSPQPSNLSPQPAHHPLTVPVGLSSPTPCVVYVVSSDPLWPSFYHYKS